MCPVAYEIQGEGACFAVQTTQVQFWPPFIPGDALALYYLLLSPSVSFFLSENVSPEQ